MQIKGMIRVSYRIIQTDADTHPTYRRSSNGGWENLVDGEWQFCKSQQKELERMYQDYVESLYDAEIQAQGFHGTR